MTVLRPSWAAVRIAWLQMARTCAESADMTLSEVFMPERARMYFLSLEATTRMSLSPSSAPSLAVAGAATDTRRRLLVAGTSSSSSCSLCSRSHTSLLGERCSTA